MIAIKHQYSFISLFLICITSFTFPMDTINSTTDIQITKPSAVAFLYDGRIAIANDEGCVIGNYDSEQGVLCNSERITHKRVLDIVVNKDKTRLSLSFLAGKIIYDVRSKKTIEKTKGVLEQSCFSPSGHNLFSYSNGMLYQYDLLCNESKVLDVAHNTSSSSISHHSINNNLIYVRNLKELSIVHIDKDIPRQEVIPIDCSVDLVDYAPYGDFVVIKRLMDDDYFMIDLSGKEKTIKAIQLKDQMDEKYFSHSFHPNASIIALVGREGSIYLFDYITGQFIAATKMLGENSFLNAVTAKSFLDISFDGKKLIAAFSKSNKCLIIDVPQNNFFESYKYLLVRKIPREIAHYIFSLFMKSHEKFHKENLVYFDLNALLNVKEMKQKQPATEDTKQGSQSPINSSGREIITNLQTNRCSDTNHSYTMIDHYIVSSPQPEGRWLYRKQY